MGKKTYYTCKVGRRKGRDQLFAAHIKRRQQAKTRVSRLLDDLYHAPDHITDLERQYLAGKLDVRHTDEWQALGLLTAEDHAYIAQVKAHTQDQIIAEALARLDTIRTE